MRLKKLLFLAFFIAFVSTPLYSYKVLFDWTKDETAGNSDWVIDRDYPNPQPTNPRNERDWDGGFSAFGFGIYSQLHDTVYTIHNATITYGESSNPMDLSNFDVFIIPEPQNPFTQAEKDAIRRFVAAGGGLLMISDHNMSDRNRSGWDSPRVFNDLGAEELFGIHFNITGDRPNSFSDISRNIPDRTHAVIEGPYGSVTALSFHAGDGMTLHPEKNPSVKGLIYKSGYNGNNGSMFAVSTYGRGRVAAIGDSSPIDDGTGDHHDHLYDGWNENGTTHPQLMLNAVCWLENRDQQNNDEPVFVIDGSLDSTATLKLENGDTRIYTGSNDTVIYIGVSFDANVERTYTLISFSPSNEVSTPWSRDGFLGKYNYYFKTCNSTQETELRDSFQIMSNTPFIHYATSRGFLEFTITKTHINTDTLYLMVTGFSTQGGGKIVYATPTIDPGSPIRTYNYYGISVRDARKNGIKTIKSIILRAPDKNIMMRGEYFDVLGRKSLPSTHSRILFNIKSHKALIILN